MSAITAEVARSHLEAWLEAELIVTQGQSYTIGKRVLTRADLGEIRKTIDYWETKVNQAEQGKQARVSDGTTRPLGEMSNGKGKR